LVGYPSADRLIEAVEFAERLNITVASSANEPIARASLGEWHQSHTLAASMIAFQDQAKRSSLLRHESVTEAEKIRAVVEIANGVRQRELAARFSADWPGAQLPALASALTLHGDIHTDFAHLILSELPLVTLDRLAASCFETIYDRAYWLPTSRRSAIHRWFVSRLLLNRPMLLVLLNNASVDGLNKEPIADLKWRSGNAVLDEELAEVSILALTYGEAATLDHDTVLKLPELESEKPYGFVLINGYEYVVGAFEESEELKLAEAIRLLKAAKSVDARFARSTREDVTRETD